MSANDIVGDLVTDLNKRATSSQAYLQGDHVQHTWGVPIPYLIFQWLIGGSSILPCQRYFGVSGEEKSYKSTLEIEMGNWFITDGGIHVHLDTENKTSPTMLDAMTWWSDVDISRRVYKVCASIGEWQSMVSSVVERARKAGPQKKGERVPMLISIDSLMARSTEEADRALRKEGAAAERGFPVSSLQVTNFLETLNLLGTTCSVSWVQHMKKAMEQTGYGVQYKEKGATAAQFSCSTHLRVRKGGKPFRRASDDSAPYEGIPVEGHEIWISTARSCVGADNRSIMVPLCWQYVPQEDGSTRQAMWFDWHGALGWTLIQMRYSDKFKPQLYKEDKERLDETLKFSESRKNSIKCDELELENASYHEFGKAIEDNIDVRDKISRFLNINEFPTVQDAEIDFEAGKLADKKKKR